MIGIKEGLTNQMRFAEVIKLDPEKRTLTTQSTKHALEARQKRNIVKLALNPLPTAVENGAME